MQSKCTVPKERCDPGNCEQRVPSVTQAHGHQTPLEPQCAVAQKLCDSGPPCSQPATCACPTLCDPMDCSPPDSSLRGISWQEYWRGLPCLPLGDLPNPGIEPRSPSLQVDSLPTEPQGKPKNTGAGSRSFLQRIFLTQELNQGLLHCRQILYQLSYMGSLILNSPILVHFCSLIPKMSMFTLTISCLTTSNLP